MLRPLILFLFLSPLFLNAQTTLQISEVKVAEKDQVRTGPDITVSLRGDKGGKSIVLYADQDLDISGAFKVRSHNVARSSVKSSAVYLTLDLRLRTGGKTDRRQVTKTFYMDDERTTQFSEKFVIKRGIDTRVITVTFNGALK